MSTSEPLVCAVMLTRDRPAMARRAVEAFRAQTYASKRLVLLSSGFHQLPFPEFPIHLVTTPGKTIGHLRNLAIEFVCDRGAPGDCPEIVVHWDDDDWSHPNRIAEQVALLQSSGADLVGYREMLFWDTRQPCGCSVHGGAHEGMCNGQHQGEAWLYRHHRENYALGTSFCYWRRTWERKRFADLPKGPAATGEDWTFLQNLHVVSVSSLLGGPRMIASIHPGNSSQAYDPANHPNEWRRVPSFDEYCRERMKL